MRSGLWRKFALDRAAALIANQRRMSVSCQTCIDLQDAAFQPKLA